MKLDLKALSTAGVPHALERAERYRLLNEPDQAESICRDILRVDPDNQAALILLILSLTDQFARHLGQRVRRAGHLIDKLKGEYERAYYRGIVSERKARAQLRRGIREGVVYEGFREAMDHYAEAERLRPSGNDDALLRWNTCVRTIRDGRLEPHIDEETEHFLE